MAPAQPLPLTIQDHQSPYWNTALSRLGTFTSLDDLEVEDGEILTDEAARCQRRIARPKSNGNSCYSCYDKADNAQHGEEWRLRNEKLGFVTMS